MSDNFPLSEQDWLLASDRPLTYGQPDNARRGDRSCLEILQQLASLPVNPLYLKPKDTSEKYNHTR